MRSRSTCRNRCVVWTLEAVLDGDSPAAMSGISIGMKNGLIRLGPPWVYAWNCVSYVVIPPMPEPYTTPMRSGSVSFAERPESLYRHVRGNDGILGEWVHSLDRFSVKELGGLEVLQFATEVRVVEG